MNVTIYQPVGSVARMSPPFRRRLARWNKKGINTVTRRLFRHLPGFGVVVHRGRRSGRSYEAPVNVFPDGDGYTFALTYGPDTDWVRNVLADGRAVLHTRGRAVPLAAPRLFRDPARRAVRPGERQVLQLLGVTEFLHLSRDAAATGGPVPTDRPDAAR